MSKVDTSLSGKYRPQTTVYQPARLILNCTIRMIVIQICFEGFNPNHYGLDYLPITPRNINFTRFCILSFL